MCVCSNVLKQKQRAMDQKDVQIKETLKRDVKRFILNYKKKHIINNETQLQQCL